MNQQVKKECGFNCMYQSEVAASAVRHHLPDYQGWDLIFSFTVESKWVPELEALCLILEVLRELNVCWGQYNMMCSWTPIIHGHQLTILCTLITMSVMNRTLSSLKYSFTELVRGSIWFTS